jgi:hypothetical protein
LLHYECLQRLRQWVATSGPALMKIRQAADSGAGWVPGLAFGTMLTLTVASTIHMHDALAQTFQPAAEGQVSSEVADQAAAPITSAPLRPQPAFARYPRYEGMLDGRRIVLRIGVNPDDPEELNGEYQFLPDGPVVLIAGGRDGNNLTLEESDDGTEISGQWVGFYATDGSLSGERMNVDQSDARPFALKPQ